MDRSGKGSGDDDEAGARRAVVDALVRAGDAARLAELAAGADARTAKEARRGLHLLRTRGHAVPAAARAPSARPLLTPAVDAAAAPPALATQIDPAGERVVWLTRAADEGGLRVYEARIAEDVGLTAFAVGLTTRRQHREFLREITGDRGVLAAVVPDAWARWLIEEAYERALAAGRPAPPAFARVRHELGPVEARFEEHPGRALAGAPLGRGESGRAHEVREVASWVPEEAELRRVALRLAEVDESRLIVDDRQRAEQRDEALARAAVDYFTPARRARLALRLIDTAYLLGLVRRDADAALLRAVAASLEAPGFEPSADPFARRLFDKIFAAAPVGPEAPTSPPGLIVPPGR